MNVSEKHKAFLWMLPKTGSIHSSYVFAFYDFKTRNFRDGKLISETKLTHNHFLVYPEKSETYIFISTARNPFTRFLSYYKFNNKDSKEWNPSHFKNFFYERVKYNELNNFFWPYSERTPDYFVRTEYLWRDYNNIPFIRNSKLNQSGALYDFCHVKFNETEKITNPQEFFTEEIKDYFFTKGKKYFDLLNYSYPF